MLVKTKKLWPIKIATCHKKILFTYFILWK
jgi:hypothetical protein